MIEDKIKRKLRSNKGTSIFFGLLLFLVASILCTVMLNASVTTVKRVESDKKAEQNYLTCSSAAKLLRDAIANIEIKKVTTVTETVHSDGTRESNQTVSWSAEQKTTGTTTVAADNIKSFLLDYVKSYNERNLADTTAAKQNCTVSVQKYETDNTKEGMNDVTAEFEIIAAEDGKAYTIVIKLKTGEGTDTCQMAVKLDGNIEVNTPPSDKNWIGTSGYQLITTTTAVYSWRALDTVYGDKVRTSGEN